MDNAIKQVEQNIDGGVQAAGIWLFAYHSSSPSVWMGEPTGSGAQSCWVQGQPP